MQIVWAQSITPSMIDYYKYVNECNIYKNNIERRPFYWCYEGAAVENSPPPPFQIEVIHNPPPNSPSLSISPMIPTL